MSRRYSDEEKSQAVQHLHDNYYNVTLTAIQTGIPLRTLYEWKRQRQVERIKGQDAIPEDILNEEVLLQQENSVLLLQQNEYTRIRQRLLEHIFELIDTLNDDPHATNTRVSAVSRLLDRVIKLEGRERSELSELRFDMKYGREDYSQEEVDV